MKKYAQVGLLLCTLLLAVHALGQQPSGPSAMPTAKRQKIAKLIQLTGIVPIAIDGMKAQMDSVKKLLPFPPKAQDDFATEMVEAVTPEAFTDLVIPVYDKYLSDEDLDGLIAYYESPLGQKMIKLLPQITNEARLVGQQWGAEIGRKAGERIGRKVQEGAYGPWPPPTPPKP